METPSRRRIFPGGLRAQLLLPSVALLVGVLALITVAVLHLTRQQLERSAADRATGHARLITARMGQALEAETRQRELARQLAAAELTLAAWQPVGGQALVAGPAGQPQRAEVLRAHLDGGEDVALRESGEVTLLLATHRTGAGAAVAAIDVAPLQTRLDATRELLWVYVVINAVFLLFLGYALFTYMVIRPIRAIGVATERAAQGDLASPISVTPRNELGQVARRFNRMLERLDIQRRELTLKVEALEAANAELATTQESLLRSEKLASVGQLAAGVAHEVGNPLAAVYGYAELLAEGDLEEDMTAEIGGRIARQVERMQAIIRELLDFSRDDSEEPLRPVDLHDCVREAISLAGATSRVKRVEIREELPPELPRPHVVPSQLVQVLINLLLNAADALREAQTEAPRITLRAEADDEHIRLRVSDNGPGVPAQAAPRLFDPFFTTKPPGEGTGLGLAICLRIVQRFEGDLRLLEPEPDQGATFEIALPRPPEAQEEEPQGAP